MIKFSIIIPYFNSEKYIEKAITSVVSQSYKNFELLLIDDGSTDTSSTIAQKYALSDKRVRPLFKNNGGYPSAVNYGLDNLAADSDYFLFLGSDDELEIDCLKKLNNAVEKKLPDVVCFGCKKVFENGTTTNDPLSVITSSVFVENTNVQDFYNLHPELPRLLYFRDTSRAFKTSKLFKLRYYGKTGIDADGVFSILFSYNCSSFMHIKMIGYIWNVRSDSVSGGGYSFLKRLDAVSSWTSFFNAFVQQKTIAIEITNHFLRYKDFLLAVILVDKEKYKTNKKIIKNACGVVLKQHKFYEAHLSVKEKIIFLMPNIVNSFYNKKYIK